MQNSRRAVRRVNESRATALHGLPKKHKPTTDLTPSRKHAARTKTYADVPKTGEIAAILESQPRLRISPVAQAGIIELYMKGYGLTAISRETHRSRQTVTKICHSEEVQATIRELRGKLLSQSERWLESVAYAVDHELDGKLAYQLLKDFDVIPSPAAGGKPERETAADLFDKYKLTAAMQLGLVALERNKIYGSSLPIPKGELDQRVRKALAAENNSKHDALD